jgi:hypothetical protein
MRSQRLAVILTVINLVLLVFLLTQARLSIGGGGVRFWASIQGPVLRGRSLEIIDEEGRVRASITVHPGETASTGGTSILRLVDENGRPSVKLSTTVRGGGGLALVSEQQGTYVQLSGHGVVVTKDGQRQQSP